jgi:hypothetical protein
MPRATRSEFRRPALPNLRLKLTAPAVKRSVMLVPIQPSRRSLSAIR